MLRHAIAKRLALPAVGLFLGGCIDRTTSPTALPEPEPVFAGAPNAARITTHDVLAFGTMTVTGRSKLKRTGSGISASLQTSALTPGDVVTVWIVVFNNPQACATSPCTADDRFNDDVDAHAVYGAGHVIGGNGTAGYGVHLHVGDASREDLWNQGRPALTDPFGAEIHLILRTHGQKQPGSVHDQIHSANLGCHPTCQNVQFSIHVQGA